MLAMGKVRKVVLSVVVVVVVIKSPNSAKRLTWKSFCDSTVVTRKLDNFRGIGIKTRELTNTRIEPQQPLPSETFVQLLQIGTLACTERSQWRSHDAKQRRSTSAGFAGALFRHAIDGT